MFRTTVLRAARLPRAAGLSSSSVLASTRPAALRMVGASRASAIVRTLDTPAVLSLSSSSVGRRCYSATAGAAEASKEEAKEEEKAEPVTKFAALADMGVHPNIVNTITSTMGYKNMTPVQAKTIVPALAGKDLVAQARTGTGKTLAFLVPVIQRMIDENKDLAYRNRTRAKADDIKAIILSPTRELAEQISVEAKKLCKDTGVIVQTAVGGTRKREMLLQTRRQGCHLLVATPGRLYDLLSSHTIISAPNLSALVLDEADRMLDVGFEDELKKILRFLPDTKELPRQTLLFSATIPKNVIMIARAFVNPQNFEFVQTISPDESPTHEKVPQHIVPVRGYENLFPTLLELMTREIQRSRDDKSRMPFKAIVFLPTTNFVQMTATAFRHLARQLPHLPPIFHIHSKLTQAARTDAADRFKAARSGILFSSDVTARGMDFPNVSHVIQIGVPPDREQYIHRLGRTGRAEKNGEGWVILTQNELGPAREVLVDLPIKRAGGLPSATYNMTAVGSGSAEGAEPVPVAVREVSHAMKRVPAGLLNDTYMSFFGGTQAGRRVVQDLVDGLNNWAIYGWGWPEPPLISMETARKRGLLKVDGIRIGEREAYERTRPRRSSTDDFQEGLQSGEDVFAKTFGSESFPQRSSGGRGGFGDRRGGSGDSRGGFGDRRGGFGDRRGGFGDRRGGDRGGRGGGRWGEQQEGGQASF